jgi:hypothetical protein
MQLLLLSRLFRRSRDHRRGERGGKKMTKPTPHNIISAASARHFHPPNERAYLYPLHSSRPCSSAALRTITISYQPSFPTHLHVVVSHTSQFFSLQQTTQHMVDIVTITKRIFANNCTRMGCIYINIICYVGCIQY